MTRTLLDKSRNEWQFDITDAEACKRIYQCLSITNPELKERDVFRDKYAREYKAKYRRSDGQDVSICVGISNLKRYFGAFILSFTETGLRFQRQLKSNDKKSKDYILGLD